MILTRSNYHSLEANNEYMSVSQYKSFLQCEAKTMAELRGEFKREDSISLLQGQYVHAWNSGDLEEFKLMHPEMYSSRGATKGQLKQTFKICGDCIDVIENDENMMMALEGQKEIIITAEMFGTLWKIMIDSYNPDNKMFTDLKVMKSLYDRFWDEENRIYENFVHGYKYNLQMVIYAEVERIALKRKDPLFPHLAVVTKESPPDKIILKGFTSDIIPILEEVEGNMQRILDVKIGKEKPRACGRCEYCRSIKTAKIMDYDYLLV